MGPMVVDTTSREATSDAPFGGGPGRRRATRAWWALAAAVAGLAVGLAAVIGGGTPTDEPRVRTDIGERTGYLANPGMGWQDMSSADSAFEQSVEYMRPRGGWAELNPGPGEYDWSVIDDAIAAAAERGNLLSLRIYTMRHPEADGHKVPSWVLDDGAAIVDGEVDYSNVVYQRHWATFVDALRERYDGHPALAFIDISGYGNYNEWSWQDQTAWERDWRDPETLDGHARKRLADLFLGGSGTVEARGPDGGVVTESYDYPGFTETQLVMPYAGIRQSLWYALDARGDVGWRYDCLGQVSADALRRLGDEVLERWRAAPMIYEFCAEVDWATVDAAVDLTRPVLIRDNATPVDERLEALLGQVGYRYTLDTARWPATARAGDTVTVDMWWRNTGTSPAYARLGAELQLHVGLRGPDGVPPTATVAAVTVNDWAPGRAVEATTDVAVPAELPPGAHDLVAAIVNGATGQPIELAMPGVGEDGWYVVGRIDVDGGREELGR